MDKRIEIRNDVEKDFVVYVDLFLENHNMYTFKLELDFYPFYSEEEKRIVLVKKYSLATGDIYYNYSAEMLELIAKIIRYLNKEFETINGYEILDKRNKKATINFVAF